METDVFYPEKRKFEFIINFDEIATVEFFRLNNREDLYPRVLEVSDNTLDDISSFLEKRIISDWLKHDFISNVIQNKGKLYYRDSIFESRNNTIMILDTGSVDCTILTDPQYLTKIMLDFSLYIDILMVTLSGNKFPKELSIEDKKGMLFLIGNEKLNEYEFCANMNFMIIAWCKPLGNRIQQTQLNIQKTIENMIKEALNEISP